MSSLRVAAGAIACLALLAATKQARADGARCTAAAEDGQRARAAGQLRSAHRLFLECSTEECPVLVRRDCAQWASSVDEQIPSIVVDARDGAGRDIGDVSVSIDGEIVARSLDGKGIPVDPGPHILVFARAGAPSVTEKVIIKEGARGRTFVIRFGGAAATAPTAPQREDAPNSSGAARVHTWPPWVLIGVGAVFVGTGVVVIAAAPAAPQGCSSSSELCARVPDETAAAFSERQREASRAKNQPIYGGIVVGAGVLILGGGLLWHFLEPTGPEPARSARSARLVPWSTSDAAGVAAVGTF